MLELELFNTTLAILVTEESFADSSASLKVAVFLSAAIIAPVPSQLLQSRPSPVSPMSENFLPPSSCQRPIFGWYQTGQHWKCLVYPSLPLVSKRESGSEPRLKARNVFPDCGCWLGCWEKQNRGCRVISWAAKVPHFVYRAATRCCWLQLALFYCRQQRKYKTSIMKVVKLATGIQSSENMCKKSSVLSFEQ